MEEATGVWGNKEPNGGWLFGCNESSASTLRRDEEALVQVPALMTRGRLGDDPPDEGSVGPMVERAVWLHNRENDGGTHVLIWHLQAYNRPETLCGRTTHDMEPVPTPWDEVFSRCRDCVVKISGMDDS